MGQERRVPSLAHALWASHPHETSVTSGPGHSRSGASFMGGAEKASAVSRRRGPSTGFRGPLTCLPCFAKGLPAPLFLQEGFSSWHDSFMGCFECPVHTSWFGGDLGAALLSPPSSKSCVETLTPTPGDGIRRWGLWEVIRPRGWSPRDGVSAPIRRGQRVPSSPSSPGRTQAGGRL